VSDLRQVSGFLLGFRHDITEILLKVALNTLNIGEHIFAPLFRPTPFFPQYILPHWWSRVNLNSNRLILFHILKNPEKLIFPLGEKMEWVEKGVLFPDTTKVVSSNPTQVGCIQCKIM
jgi:hypothetical protein